MKEFFNPGFRFNGQPLSYEGLSEVAYSLIKEGEPHEKEIGDFLMDWIDARTHIVQQTSGSTGKPKPMALSKLSMVHSARSTARALGLKAGMRALCPLSLRSIGGKMMWIRAMVLGMELEVVPPTSDPLSISDGDFDFAALVPLQLVRSLDQLHRLKTAIIGGAAIPASTLQRLPENHGGLYQTYGMTETCSHIALRPLQPVPAGRDPEEILEPFTAMEGIRLSLDPRGCLVIQAPDRLQSPLVTNDLVALESATRFRWLGRADRVVNSGGVKLHPERIEAKIGSRIPGRFFLTGIPDSELGEKLVLLVEGDLDTGQLKTDLSTVSGLGPYEMPKSVHAVAEFAQTESGKIDRSATLEVSSLIP